MRRLAAGLLIVFAAVALLLLAGAGFAWWSFDGKGPAEGDVTLVLQRGEGLEAISRRLEEQGVVRHASLFVLAAKLTGAARQLKAGEYRFPAHATLRETLDLLREGRTLVRRLTVPEGLLSQEVLALLSAAEGLQGELPPAPPEGSLLPETYHYAWGDSRSMLLERMRLAMADSVLALWLGRRPNLPFTTPLEAVVMASMVEKETAVPEERPRVAAVFINRLRRGMRLQSDPTVAYGLSDGKASLGRELTRADLDSATPYNTYRIDGMPPLPIANPGRASLAAVLQPLETRELYFVADGNGGHAFAETLEEHARNVRRWRRLQQGSSN